MGPNAGLLISVLFLSSLKETNRNDGNHGHLQMVGLGPCSTLFVFLQLLERFSKTNILLQLNIKIIILWALLVLSIYR